MRRLLKTTGWILTILLLLPLFAVNAGANDEMTITVDNVNGAADQTITVDINMTDNPGIAGYTLDFHYDADKLELVLADGSAAAQRAAIQNGGLLTLTQINTQTTGRIRLVGLEDENITDNSGLLFTLTFKIKAGVPAGIIDGENFKLSGTIANDAYQLVSFNVNQGSITVTSGGGATTIANGQCGDNITWTLDSEGVLTINGTGQMWNWVFNTIPWYAHRANIKTVVLSGSISSIGNHAFNSCINLENIVIPNSIVYVGRFSFNECSRLKNITIPNSVTEIGLGAFYSCTALENINVNSGNLHFTSENGILYNTAKTVLICYPAGKPNSSFTIPDNITELGQGAFYDCRNLENIKFPDNINFTSIGMEAFAHCSSLANVIIPERITELESSAFWSCSNLYDVYFESKSPPVVGHMSFFYIKPNARAIVPPDGTWPAEGTLWNELIIVYAEPDIKPDGTTITASNVSGAAGQTVTVDVNISGNPGIAGYTLDFHYDADKLELVLADGNAAAQRAAIQNGGLLTLTQINTQTSGRIRLVGLEDENITDNSGLLFTLTFKIKAGVPAGIIDGENFKLSGTIANDAYQLVPFSVNQGSITVTSGNLIYGDVTGDGEVDMADLVALARHIAGLERLEGALLEAADVNGDKRVNIADLIRLARYLADIDTSPLGK